MHTKRSIFFTAVLTLSLCALQGCTTQPQPAAQAYPVAQPQAGYGYGGYPQTRRPVDTINETASIIHTTTGVIRDIQSLNRGW